MRGHALLVLEDLAGQRDLVGEAGVYIDEEEAGHDCADEAAHEGEDHEYLLDLAVVGVEHGVLHDVEGGVAALVGDGERVVPGAEIDVVDLLLFVLREGPDRVIARYVDLGQVHV